MRAAEARGPPERTAPAMTTPRALPRSFLLSAGRAVLGVALGLALTACGDDGKSASTQTAARVGSAELTVHQLNFLLQQRGNLAPEDADRASRELLERLIDQELGAQAAAKEGLDRDPWVQQALDASHREILARAYANKIERESGAKGKPAADEVQRFYDANPLLFSGRRIYTLQQVNFDANAEGVARADAALREKRAPQPFIDALLALGLRPALQTAAYPAENLPLDQLKRLSTMTSGQALTTQRPGGAAVLFLLGSTAAPSTLDQARPLIERFLQTDRARHALADSAKALRAATPVSYAGKFAEPVAAAAAAAPAVAAAPNAAPDTAATPPKPAAAAQPSDSAAFRKGVEGLK